MKDQILKIAKCKTEKEFYSKYPSEEAFMKIHGKAFKKAQYGAAMNAVNQYTDNKYKFTPGYADSTNSMSDDFDTSGQNPYMLKTPQLTGDPSYGANTQYNPDFAKQPEKQKKNWAQGVPLVGKLVGAGQALHDEKHAMQKAQQWEKVSDVALKASQSRDVDFNRMNKQMQWRPEDNITSGNELFPINGTGTNILAAKKGGKIPKAQWGQMLQGLGGAKQIGGSGKFMQGFQQFAGAGGVDTISKGISSLTGENAGGDMGGTVGGTIGSIWGPVGQAIGQIGGQLIGTAIDRRPAKIKAAKNDIYRNINQMAFGQGARGLQNQNNSFMRTGGNIRQNNIPDLQLYDGGTEQVSPDTIKFTGNSHAEGGQDITYGGNPVEVEGNEYASEMPDGKTGEDNLVVFGNLKNPLTGRKFKKDAGELAKAEERQTNVTKKATEKIGAMDISTPHDKLAFTSLKLMNMGANMKLKVLADEKATLSAMQSAINDTAEEYKLDADNLAKGNIKRAKYGKNIAKAVGGKTVAELFPNRNKIAIDDSKLQPMQTLPPEYDPQQELLNSDYNSNKGLNPWITGINAMLPLIRPSDAEQLDPQQLAGEMYAMSTNQLEPIQAQTYNPQLSTPYDISLQDMLNENTASTRAAQRLMGYNPAAEAAVVGQAYGANQKVLGEQFRMNQQMKDKVYGENRNALNDAQLKNLGIYDNQYTRQAEAKSNTKAVTQAALNSISDKFLKNKLENRTLAINENLYNYRFDRRGRAWNWNPLAQFDTTMGGNASSRGKVSGIPDDWMTLYDENGKFQGTKKRTKSTEEKNGGLVRAIKNL
jgi:hypothetical protein